MDFKRGDGRFAASGLFEGGLIVGGQRLNHTPFSISPDGRLLAFHKGEHIELYEMNQGMLGLLNRFDVGDTCTYPVFASSSNRLAFGCLRNNEWFIEVRDVRAAGRVSVVSLGQDIPHAIVLSPDGRYVVYTVVPEDPGGDELYIADLSSESADEK